MILSVLNQLECQMLVIDTERLFESYIGKNLDTVMQDSGAASIVGLVNKLLVRALREDVSSLHLEPQNQGLKIRARKNGKLTDFLTTGSLPKAMIPAIAARIKVIADLDIAERRLPQTGTVRRVFGERKIDIRVSTLPSRFGEAITLQLLAHTDYSSIEDLIPNPDSLSSMRDMMVRSRGVLIVTGTSGREKDTLYALLKNHGTADYRVITIEQTLDHTLADSTQVLFSPYQPDKNQLTLFLACLKQEPDIVLLDTLDDHLVAEAAFKAAQRQCLIVTTMAALDPISAIQQLLAMGVAPYAIARSLIGVIGQQFVRRLCDSCRDAYSLTPETSAQFELPLEPYQGATFYRPAASSSEGTICANCDDSAYQGQIAVHEILRITDSLRQLIRQSPSADSLRTAAEQEGLSTYFEQAMPLAQRGLTSIEEIEHMVRSQQAIIG